MNERDLAPDPGFVEQLQELVDQWRQEAAAVTPGDDSKTRAAYVRSVLIDCSDSLSEVIDEHRGR